MGSFALTIFHCCSNRRCITLSFAYETWRSVVTFLYHNKGVVGVFTDYNEYSGVNCAGLAGHESRQSLCMNPFRQPRAMPVYSMNLPQFSNSFLYVFNPQELD
jgi:hypothetical protein